jgi:anti-anti-sigma factor
LRVYKKIKSERKELVMIINKSQENEIVTLALDGRLDTITASQLEAALSSAVNESDKVVLDFTNLTYVSSAGLRVLLLGRKASKAKGASMVLKCVAAEIMEIFEITGFLGVLDFE